MRRVGGAFATFGEVEAMISELGDMLREVCREVDDTLLTGDFLPGDVYGDPAAPPTAFMGTLGPDENEEEEFDWSGLVENIPYVSRFLSFSLVIC